MKKILVVVFAVVVMLGAAQVNAQVPYVQVYFDEFWQVSVLESCPDATPVTVAQTVYVVAHNFNMWMNGIEYMISYPTEMLWLGDSIGPDRLSIGNSPNPLLLKSTEGLETNKWGCLVADEESGQTSRPHVYAGGDVVTGAATVILAAGAGKNAAGAIHTDLSASSEE